MWSLKSSDFDCGQKENPLCPLAGLGWTSRPILPSLLVVVWKCHPDSHRWLFSFTQLFLLLPFQDLILQVYQLFSSCASLGKLVFLSFCFLNRCISFLRISCGLNVILYTHIHTYCSLPRSLQVAHAGSFRSSAAVISIVAERGFSPWIVYV